MRNRKICVVTGSRAEYGLLYWLMREIEKDQELLLQLIVTGSHLETYYGNTVEVIEADNFKINARIPIQLVDDTPISIANSQSLALNGIIQAFSDLNPDIIVLLGDRFEILAAAEAAMLSRKILAHIHGGEATEGAIDEAIRHAITKMSHLHFPSAEPYRQRIIQMGEDPQRVFTVGAPGLDNIEKLDLLDRKMLSAKIGFDLMSEYFLITFHPETLSKYDSLRAVNGLLLTLNDYLDTNVIFTGVNADLGSSAVTQLIKEYAKNNESRVKIINSLGQLNYLSALKHCRAVIGNSSSGIIEAPAFGVPTLNIGNRQRGRLRASSIVDCDGAHNRISKSLKYTLSDAHCIKAKNTINPYGKAGASKKIKQHLKHIDLDGLLLKKFYNLAVNH